MSTGWVAAHRRNNTESERVCRSVVHRELRCEDCDVLRMARLSLGQVDDLRREGRVTQEDWEAYEWLHRQLSPYRAPSRKAPGDADVLRIVRKLVGAKPGLSDRPELEGLL